MHIYIPMGAKYTYEQVKLFAQIIAEKAVENYPKQPRLSAAQQKDKKKYT